MIFGTFLWHGIGISNGIGLGMGKFRGGMSIGNFSDIGICIGFSIGIFSYSGIVDGIEISSGIGVGTGIVRIMV